MRRVRIAVAPAEKFGDVDLPDLCARLAEAGFLHLAGGNYHWTHEAYPADTISLRSVTSDNFVIIDITGTPNVIGEIDFPSALVFLTKKLFIFTAASSTTSSISTSKSARPTSSASTSTTTPMRFRYTQVRVLEIAEQARGSESHREIL